MDRIAGTDEVQVFEQFWIIELFLKRQSGARETGDEYDGRFGRVSGSMSPNFSTVLGLHELSEGWHGEEIRILLDRRGRERGREEWCVGFSSQLVDLIVSNEDVPTPR